MGRYRRGIVEEEAVKCSGWGGLEGDAVRAVRVELERRSRKGLQYYGVWCGGWGVEMG